MAAGDRSCGHSNANGCGTELKKIRESNSPGNGPKEFLKMFGSGKTVRRYNHQSIEEAWRKL